MGEIMEKAVRKKKDICSYTYEELAEEMRAAGEKAFRAKQIYQWLHVKLADSFEEMTNLSKSLREKLDEEYQIAPVELVERQISKADPTEKFLFELEDGNMVESVLMKYDYGNSVCISSRRAHKESDDLGDAAADLQDTEDNRGESVQHRGHGHRGASGQLRQFRPLCPHGQRP